MKHVLAVLLLIAASAVPASALAYASPGSPTGHVNDFAHVLSDQAKQSLEAELTDFEKTTSNEIAVAIVPSMSGDYVENYAVKLFEEWKIGKKDRDNGVLLVLSIEEHKMRIEVGYGLEGALPDSLAQSILNIEMTPRLKAGDYDGAVTAGIHAIEAATKGEYTGSGDLPSAGINGFLLKNAESIIVIGFVLLQLLSSILARSRSWWAGGIVGFLAGLSIWGFLALGLIAALLTTSIFIALGLLFDYIVSRGYTNAKSQGRRVPWWAGGPGSSGSGGGFGGFGGGGSGGGGASGGW